MMSILLFHAAFIRAGSLFTLTIFVGAPPCSIILTVSVGFLALVALWSIHSSALALNSLSPAALRRVFIAVALPSIAADAAPYSKAL
jgi:hypothetical protein